MVGEAMALWYPTGIRYGQHISYICPGGYATVGRDTNGSIGGYISGSKWRVFVLDIGCHVIVLKSYLVYLRILE